MSHTIEVTKCTRCGLCQMLCPQKLFELGEKSMQFVKEAPQLCLRCGHCIAACPEDAIRIEGMDMNTFPSLTSNAYDYEAFQAMLLSRRSIRSFKDQPVEKEMIDKILTAVATAPSGMGLGPPPICIINGREKIEPMIKPIMEFYRKFHRRMKGGISKIMMRLMLGKNQYIALTEFMPVMDRMFEYYDATGEDVITWGAPLLFIFHAPRTSISGSKDAMIACTYAMLAAHSLGLGTTMIGMIPPYIERNKEARGQFNIPKGNEVVLSLIAGHPKMKFSRGILKPAEINWI